MPRGDKSKYSDKQQRKAEHIEESYKAKGVSESEAEARAWATVNKQSGGGERKGGSEPRQERDGQARRPQGLGPSRRPGPLRETGQPRLGEPWQTSGQHLGERDDPRGIDAAGAQARHSRSFDDAQGRTDRGPVPGLNADAPPP